MTLKETTVNYCDVIISSLQAMIDARDGLSSFLDDDPKRRDAFKVMVEHDPVIKEKFEKIGELAEKLEM